jgi:hypothetical protein
MARSDRAARPRRRRGRRDQPVYEYFFRLPAARGARERFAAFGCIVRRAETLLLAAAECTPYCAPALLVALSDDFVDGAVFFSLAPGTAR